MSFTNLYYQRTTATPKACYVCYKPTTTCLATINTTDFLYTCPTHLSDPGFASAVGESGNGAAGARKIGLSAEEIAKVKEEWEERQRLKKEKAKEKEKEKEKKEEGDKDEDKKEAGDDVKEKKSSVAAPSPTSGSSTPSTAAHPRYSLHRDFFAMRLAEHRKRRQAAQAKELAPRLPGAPKGNP
ncbi:DUF1742-domain-containing protein [Pleurotus eryngii]|uniref:DUF1742-domain-containing protein n=1 Tax=Pleurotus eryngii TaxID=5323 RepID=A0A9P5ZZ37_PLEER|nr:DUF1742-domain-containing protein [Pleurotus eryngii]